MDSNFQVKITADLGDLVAKIKNIETTLAKLDSSFKGVNARASQSLQKTGEAAASAGLDMNRMRLASFALGQVIRDSGFFAQSFGLGLLAISNNVPILIDQIVMLSNVSKGLGIALSMMGSILTAALTIFAYASMGADKYNDSLDKIRATADTNVITLNTLLAVAKDVTLSDQVRQQAINKLNDEYKVFNNALTINNINSKIVLETTNKLTRAIYLQAEAQILNSELQDTIAEKRKLEKSGLKENASSYQKFTKAVEEGFLRLKAGLLLAPLFQAGQAAKNFKSELVKLNIELEKKGLANKNAELQKFDDTINALTATLGTNTVELAKNDGLSDPEKIKDQSERLKKLKDIYTELSNEIKKVEYDTFSSELEKANTLVDAHKKALQSLIELGLTPLDQKYQTVYDGLLKSLRAVNDEEGKSFAGKLQLLTIANQAKSAVEAETDAKEKQIEIQKQLNALGTDSIAAELTDDPTYEILKKRNEAFDEMNKKILDFRDLMSDTAHILVGPLASAFETMIQTGNFGIKGLVDMLKQMIIKLIAAVAAAAILALIFAAITGGTSATAGGGGFLKMFQGLMGGKGMFPGLKPRAKGGIFSGPSAALVGEYPGAKNNPEVIAPLDKLKSLIGNSGGNGNMVGQLETRVSGNDLVILMNRASKNRNGYY
jgi:hypothetical protein